MNSVIRTLDSSHSASFGELLDEGFQLPTGKSFFDDFPVWGPHAFSSVVRKGFVEGNVVVASACLRVARLKRKGALIKVAVLGAVATRTSHRGQGLASKIVEALLVEAKSLGCEAAFLWGSEHSLYARLGFELTGQQLRVPVTAFGGGGLVLQQGACPEIAAEILKRNDGLEYDDCAKSLLLKHKNVSWVWVKSGGTFAFAGYNRGIDLTGIVHEWGGDSKLLNGLFGTLATAKPELQIFAHPSHLSKLGLTSMPVGVVSEKQVLACKLSASFQWAEPTWFWGLDSG